jgi:hypothetical protein
MSGPKADQLAYRGVYGVFDGPTLQYVGSTSARLENLERNHREWRSKNYSPTKFRKALETDGESWTFVWLVQPKQRIAIEVETLEQLLINTLNPVLNQDKNPVESSKKYGRY